MWLFVIITTRASAWAIKEFSELSDSTARMNRMRFSATTARRLSTVEDRFVAGDGTGSLSISGLTATQELPALWLLRRYATGDEVGVGEG